MAKAKKKKTPESSSSNGHKKGRKYRRVTNRVNPLLKMPALPNGGKYVDYEECICGARYEWFRAFTGPSQQRFSEAATHCRVAFGGYDTGGGYRSFGPILYMLRILKTQAWLNEHMAHDEPIDEATLQYWQQNRVNGYAPPRRVRKPKSKGKFHEHNGHKAKGKA